MYLHAAFSDKAPYTYSSENVRTDAILTSVSGASLEFETKSPVLLTLEIDKTGRATLQSVNATQPVVTETLKEWATKLTFIPATYSQHAVASQQELLLQFQETREIEGGRWPSSCEEVLRIPTASDRSDAQRIRDMTIYVIQLLNTEWKEALRNRLIVI